ncbi:MAG: HAD family hydrolase [Candidatus Marinimicrobia bacterium]|nr:HAD family hydrolase [Candidatus Neomarinimicrobiota bacterium]|tara:strand:+ start:11131 stop:11781 length:651 start_codon:yes stop_codon:yes gene_type:complete
MKYSGLMLDFGGVILKTPFEMHRLVEKKLGIKNNTLSWYGPFNPESDLLWEKMQNDEITEQEYWIEKSKIIGDLINKKWTLRDYMTCCYHGFNENDIIREEAVTTIKKIKDYGYQVGILTNEIEYFHGKDWMDNIQILKEVEYLIDGSITKSLKPSSKAYEIAIKASGLDTKEIIFIDDQLRNVHGAKNMGMHSIHFDVRNPMIAYQKALTLLKIK